MKSLMKSIIVCTLAGCVLFPLATSTFSGEWKVPAEWKFIKFQGGGAAGSWTPSTAKICELINKQIPGVNSSSTLGSSYGNVEGLNRGRTQMCFTQADALAICYYGLGKMKGKATKNVRFLGAMHYGVYYAFVPKKSDIKDLSVIAKKPLRTASGPPGSTMYMFTDSVLKAYGSSVKDLEARGGTVHKTYYGPACSMMKNGQLDYLSFNTSTNASFIMDIATRPGIRFLEFGPREKALLKKWLPGITEIVVPKDMYPNIKKDYPTLAVYYVIIVPKDMPEELAYRVTKVIWDNLGEVQAIGAFGKYIRLETAFNGMTIPMHPGSARYYKEKGMTPPKPKVPEF